VNQEREDEDDQYGARRWRADSQPSVSPAERRIWRYILVAWFVVVIVIFIALLLSRTPAR